MDVTEAVNIFDLQKMAERRLPEIVRDFLEGGCDDEEGLAHNRAVMTRYRLVPQYCSDVTQRSLTTELFGKTYAAPFGIAPTGQAGLFRNKAELMFAEAAKKANVPYMMSMVSSVLMEDCAKKAGGNLWVQFYNTKDVSILEDLVKRAKNCGVQTIAFTVDVPVSSNREGLRRNGFMGKMPWRIKFEALKHPGWMMEYLTYGEPKLANYLQYAGGDQKKALGIIMPPAYTWEHVQRLRDLWKGPLLIKGILSPKDAAKAVELGADGIYVSNHGGRQLNRSPAPFEMLPVIRKAIGDRAMLVVDSGVRRGSDVILARAMGASLALMGRVPNYGAAAGGLKGVEHSLEIIRREADMVLGQMGCTSVKDLGPHMLFDSQRGEFCA